MARIPRTRERKVRSPTDLGENYRSFAGSKTCPACLTTQNEASPTLAACPRRRTLVSHFRRNCTIYDRNRVTTVLRAIRGAVGGVPRGPED